MNMLKSSIEDNQDVLQTILVNELRSVYNIKYHKDSSKPKKQHVRHSHNFITIFCKQHNLF